MPKTKTRPTKNSSKKFKPAKKLFGLNRWLSIFIIAVIALVGGYYIFKSFAASTKPIMGIAGYMGRDDGYYYASQDGGVYAYGTAPFFGSAYGKFTYSSTNYISGISTPHYAPEYYLTTNNGQVFAFNGKHYGDIITNHIHLSAPIVGIVVNNNGTGYWLVARDGGVFAFGAAGYYGSLPSKGIHVNNIVGIALSSGGAGHGYLLTGADGGVFAFGDAPFKGSVSPKYTSATLTKPVSGIVRGHGGGYYLGTQDGRVFTFGSPYYGCACGKSKYPITGIALAGDSNGYWMVAQDGGVFAIGSAQFKGNTAATYTPPSCQSLNANQRGTWPNCRTASCLIDGGTKTQGTWPNCVTPPPAPSPVATKTCPDGTKVLATATCPDPAKPLTQEQRTAVCNMLGQIVGSEEQLLQGLSNRQHSYDEIPPTYTQAIGDQMLLKAEVGYSQASHLWDTYCGHGVGTETITLALYDQAVNVYLQDTYNKTVPYVQYLHNWYAAIQAANARKNNGPY